LAGGEISVVALLAKC